MLFQLLFFHLFCLNLAISFLLGSWWGVGIGFGFFSISLFVGFLGALFFGCLGMIFGKYTPATQFQKFIQYLFFSWKWIMMLFLFFPWIFYGCVVFINTFSPTVLPKITLSNGEKTVIFQSMIHVGSPEFYQSIAEDMKKLRDDDFVFFYEGVQSGTDESILELSRLMGMNVSEKMYDQFAQLGGLVPQEVSMFTGLLPSTNIDLTTDQIVQLAKEANITPPASLPFLDKIDGYDFPYESLNSLQKKVIQEGIHALLNLLLVSYTHPDLEHELKKSVPIFDIILHSRNELLVQAILESPSKNIYIHYGALHYNGILEGLQKNDPKWKEGGREYFKTL